MKSDQKPVDEHSRIEAARLFEHAKELAARGAYDEARKRYECSLRLCEDPIVREAYFKFLATIGPM